MSYRIASSGMPRFLVAWASSISVMPCPGSASSTIRPSLLDHAFNGNRALYTRRAGGADDGEEVSVSEEENRGVIERYWSALERSDFDAAVGELHEDFAETFPQSGETIRGRDNFLGVLRNFPSFPSIRVIGTLVADPRGLRLSVRGGRVAISLGWNEADAGSMIEHCNPALAVGCPGPPLTEIQVKG